MKKLMGISVIAMLAVAAGFSAHAAVTDADATHDTGTAQLSAAQPAFALVGASDTDDNAASAGYVKGAYNAAIKAINRVNDNVNSNLATSGGAGIKKTGNVISVDLTANGGLQTTGEGNDATLGVKVDGNTIEIDSTNGVQVKNSGITTAKINDGAVTFGKVASDAVVNSTNGINANVEQASDSKLVTEKAVRSAMDTAVNGMVTLDGTQELSNKTLNGGTLKTGTTLTATGATISGGTITGATIDSANNTISNIVVGDMATAAVATGSAQGATNDKLTTKDYVDEAVAGLNIGDYATKTGVDNTINKLTATSTVNDNFTLTSGTVNGAATIKIMKDWSNPNTASDLTVDTSALAVNTAITEGTVTTTVNKTSYADAQNPAQGG